MPARYTPKRYHAAPPTASRTTQFLQAVLVASLLTCGPIFFGIYLLASQQPSKPQTKVAGISFSRPIVGRNMVNTPIINVTFPTPVQNLLASLPSQSPTPAPTDTPAPISTPTPEPSIQAAPTDQSGCTETPFPDSQSTSSIITQFQSRWHIALRDGRQSWTNPSYHRLLSIWWQTISQLSCTPYLGSLLGGHTLTVTANDLGMWWGQYDGAYQQEINIADQNQSLSQPSHIQQNIVHELTHVWRDTHFNDTYQIFANQLCGNGNPNAYISNYGATNCSEDLSEAVGYYVIRQATEWQTNSPYCASKNPYDWGQASTYNWIKTNLFNGQQFGPPPPTTPTNC